MEEEGSLSQRQRLTAEVSALGEEEQRLEQLIQRCTQDVRHLSELASNQKYPFFSKSTHLQIDKVMLSLHYYTGKTPSAVFPSLYKYSNIGGGIHSISLVYNESVMCEKNTVEAVTQILANAYVIPLLRGFSTTAARLG